MDTTGPTITAEQLRDELFRQQMLDETSFIELMGPERHGMSLHAFELALEQANILSSRRLALLKGALSGLPPAPEDTRVTNQLPFALVRELGALVLENDPLTVGLLEDLPANVMRLHQQLGTDDVALQLLTASQFEHLIAVAYEAADRDMRRTAGEIYEIFDEAVRRGASDIHLSVGYPPVIRLHGELRQLKRKPLDIEWMAREVARIAGEPRLQQVEADYDVDFAYTYGPARFRINLGRDRYGLTLAARTLPTAIPTMDQLALPSAVREMCNLERGLVLVTGPTGSGKSTTLASMLQHIADQHAKHLVTLEQPIEFHLSGARAVIHQREMGSDFIDFAQGLRQSLRQDPDVMLVGEMRDLDTIRAALTAAETGHLVFGTLHTYDAASTLARVVSAFPADEQDQIRSQLAYILKGVVSQTLIPTADAKGRVAAFEVLVATAAVANNLRKPDGHTQIRHAVEGGSGDGMQTMDMALAKLVRSNTVRRQDAELRVREPDEFARRLGPHAF